jgi:hypothetical protein
LLLLAIGCWLLQVQQEVAPHHRLLHPEPFSHLHSQATSHHWDIDASLVHRQHLAWPWQDEITCDLSWAARHPRQWHSSRRYPECNWQIQAKLVLAPARQPPSLRTAEHQCDRASVDGVQADAPASPAAPALQVGRHLSKVTSESSLKSEVAKYANNCCPICAAGCYCGWLWSAQR